MRKHLARLILLVFIPLLTFHSKVHAFSCSDNEWLKDLGPGQKEELLLLQTQVTALKLASLIDVYQNPKSNEEKEKAIDLISKIGGPLNENHPFINRFEEGPKSIRLMALIEEAKNALSSGSLKISYDSMPALLMAYELSSKNGVFTKKDFAVATFWEENNPNQNMVNPILEQLTSIYHEMSREEREALYSKVAPTLNERWQELTDKAAKEGCLPQANIIISHCSDQAAKILEELAVPFETLSLQVTKILSHDLAQQLQSMSLGNIEWKLHPPPKETETPPREETKTFDKEIFTEYRQQRSWYEEISDKDNLGFIQTFKKLEAEGPYLVLDKAKRRIFLYESEGTLKGSIEAGLEISFDRRADEAMGSDRGAGAGIYSLNETKGSLLTLKDQRGRGQILTTEKNGIDCSTGGCTQFFAGLGELLERHNTKLPLPFYILPLDENLEFVIKNDQLSFTTFEKLEGYYRYNFSPKNKEPFPTRFEVTDPAYNTEFSREFLKGLEEEKAKLMELYNLDNDEFNELAVLAFGILGQESQFGSHWRYKVKETFPGGVAYLKNYKKIFSDFKEDKEEEGFWSAVGDLLSDSWTNDIDFITGDISLRHNSRGPTQIKRVPDLVRKNYGITKEQLEEPKKAAVATLGFLAQSLEELKAKEKYHPAINGKNRFEYLHYIYMGKSSEIINGTATPDKNIYYQNVLRFSKSLKVWQDLTNS